MTKVEAMDKIRDEMAKAKNPAVETLGEWMTAWLGEHPEGGEKVLAEGKTLEGAYKVMETEARKKRGSGAVCMEDTETAQIVAGYYGIPPMELLQAVMGRMMAQLAAEGVRPTATPKAEPQADAESLTGVLDLDALLGGL
jgi:hypothetical protein